MVVNPVLWCWFRCSSAQEDEEASQRGQGIPGFWARVLSNVEELEDSIQERDTDALEFLKDIRVERKAGSKVHCRFAFHLSFFGRSHLFFRYPSNFVFPLRMTLGVVRGCFWCCGG